MSQPNHLSETAHPALIPTGTVAIGQERRLCATPHCHNVVKEPWEETGTLCADCAIESDLSDREGRWDRCFPMVH